MVAPLGDTGKQEIIIGIGAGTSFGYLWILPLFQHWIIPLFSGLIAWAGSFRTIMNNRGGSEPPLLLTLINSECFILRHDAKFGPQSSAYFCSLQHCFPVWDFYQMSFRHLVNRSHSTGSFPTLYRVSYINRFTGNTRTECHVGVSL